MNMQRVVKTTCLSLLVFGLPVLWNGKVLLAATNALDGQTFVGEVGEKGKTEGNRDNLIFKDGKFRSTACDPYGFGESTYTATVTGDATTFEAQTISPTDGTMQWKGTVKGNTVEGTATWLKPGKAPVEHWVKAELKK